MRVYLSSRYDRRLELLGYAAELEAEGIEVGARWLAGALASTPETALIDAEDTCACDVFVTFSEEPVMYSPLPYASRGGRHVEFGMAHCMGIPIIVVGPQENVFHLLPRVVIVPTWAEAKAELIEAAMEEVGDRIVRAACTAA